MTFQVKSNRKFTIFGLRREILVDFKQQYHSQYVGIKLKKQVNGKKETDQFRRIFRTIT